MDALFQVSRACVRAGWRFSALQEVVILSTKNWGAFVAIFCHIEDMVWMMDEAVG